MKNFISRLWEQMNVPKTERLLIILIPCLTLLIIISIIAPTVIYFTQPADGEVISENGTEDVYETIPPSLTPAETFIPVAQSAAPVAAAETPAATAAAAVRTQMSAISTEHDLYIKVKDENGNAIQGQNFVLSFTYPDGTVNSFKADSDGTCYLVDLPAGEYAVTMQPQEGFEAAQPISCNVKEQVEYVQIEDIDEIVDVVDSTEISQSEIKPAAVPIEPIEPEYLNTPEEAQNGEVVIEDAPVYDENGNQKYLYTFNVGPGGSLLYKGSNAESGVVPVDENNDGIPEYGLKWVSVEPQYDEFSGEAPSASTGYYVSVSLFNADNTPVSTYDITAIPVTETITSLVGWQNIDGKKYYYDSYGRKATGLKNIDGKLYYFNQFGVAASSLGIDVSFYNDSINWPAVKAQGIDFAIIRVGGRGWETGSLYDDTCFVQNLSGAKNAGIKVGVYFYSTAIDAVEAVQEASLVLNRLNGTPLDFPVYIDVEQSGNYPRGRSDTLNKAMRNEVISAFCETIRNYGYRAGIYSGAYFLTNNIDYSSISKYNVWIANYTSFNRVPNFSGRYDMWQFTDSGLVNGIPNIVDMNAIFN